MCLLSSATVLVGLSVATRSNKGLTDGAGGTVRNLRSCTKALLVLPGSTGTVFVFLQGFRQGRGAAKLPYSSTVASRESIYTFFCTTSYRT